jgi:hypothetical protein
MVESNSWIDDARTNGSWPDNPATEVTPRGRCAAEVFRAEVSGAVLEIDDGSVNSTSDLMGRANALSWSWLSVSR